jgi:hypothetical protein
VLTISCDFGDVIDTNNPNNIAPVETPFAPVREPPAKMYTADAMCTLQLETEYPTYGPNWTLVKIAAHQACDYFTDFAVAGCEGTTKTWVISILRFFGEANHDINRNRVSAPPQGLRWCQLLIENPPCCPPGYQVLDIDPCKGQTNPGPIIICARNRDSALEKQLETSGSNGSTSGEVRHQSPDCITAMSSSHKDRLRPESRHPEEVCHRQLFTPGAPRVSSNHWCSCGDQ